MLTVSDASRAEDGPDTTDPKEKLMPTAYETTITRAPRKNWLAVACAQHVRKVRELGVMEVCHGSRSCSIQR